MIGYIYIIRNTVNSLVYVGLTASTIARRWGTHKGDAKRSNVYFYREIRKIGFEHFYLEILEECQADTKYELIQKLNKLEEKWVDIYQSNKIEFGYNSRAGGSAAAHSQQAILEKSKRQQPLSDHENQMKYCPECEQTKPYSSFTKHKSASFGLAAYCSDCRKIMRKIPEEEFHYKGKIYNNENEKYCGKCDSVKPISEFYDVPYRIAYCIACLREKAKKEYHAKKAKLSSQDQQLK